MLRDVANGLAEVLRGSVGTELADAGIDIQIEPRLVTTPSAPICVDIYPSDLARTGAAAAFGDISGQYVLTVRARANPNDGDEWQDILTDMLDDFHELSVGAALESNKLLDGYATDVAVDPDGFSGMLAFPGVPNEMVGCTWRVLVGVAFS